MSSLKEYYAAILESKQRYEQMFQVLSGKGLDREIDKEIEFARFILKREDRIVWYLRMAKIKLFSNAINTPTLDATDKVSIQKALDESAREIAAKTRSNTNQIISDARVLDTYKTSFKHFASLFESIPKLNALQWQNQRLVELLDQLRHLESEALGKLNLAESSQSSFLNHLVQKDQQERQQYQQFVKTKMNGDYDEGAKVWAKKKNRSVDDIFGERQRQEKFMKVDFDFSQFTESDWEKYWLIAQHCDWNRGFQKKALQAIKQYLGNDNELYKYLYDRISCGVSGSQRYGTQDICNKD